MSSSSFGCHAGAIVLFVLAHVRLSNLRSTFDKLRAKTKAP